MAGGDWQLNDINVIRGRRRILDINALHIATGEFINIIGANGAGKSTLLHVLGGLLKPTAGEVSFNNTPLYALSPWRRTLLKKQIGYIPQTAAYNAETPFTVRDVVAMGRTSAKRLFAGLNRTDHGIVEDWIGRVGLSDRKDQTFRSLSGGEQQKTLIARAMAQHPSVLLLDEPTSNLDFHWKGKITRLVKDLHRQLHLTVVMISHELTALPLEPDRTVLLDQGSIIADDISERVLTSEHIGRVYQCNINIHDINGKKYLINQDIITT